jgi:hypothetical protein
MTYTEEDEREAHIENMKADTHYKLTMAGFEFWKVLIAGIIAAAAIAGVLGYKLGSIPPAPIVIQQLPPPK